MNITTITETVGSGNIKIILALIAIAFLSMFFTLIYKAMQKKKIAKALANEVQKVPTEQNKTETPKAENKHQPFVVQKKGMNPQHFSLMSLIVGAVGVALGLAWSYKFPTLITLMWVVGILGMMCIGMPLGALLFTKEMRCRIYKFIFKQQYGIVNIVTDKSIISMIANLDNDYLEINDRLFIIQKSRLYYQTEDGKQGSKPIKSEDVKFVAGVPTLFLDANSIIPLTFKEDGTKITPQEISAPLKAYIITKEAEFLQFKKNIKMSVYGIIVAIALAIMLSYYTNSIIKGDVLPLLRTAVDGISQIVTKVGVPNIVNQVPVA